MIRPIGVLGKYGYGILYLPSITFGYLYLNVNKGNLAVLPSEIPFFGYGLSIPSFSIPHSQLPLLAVVALIGGMWLHQFSTVVYGHDGPSQQPKDNAVVRTVMFGLAFNVPIQELRQTRSYISLVLQGFSMYNRGSIMTFLVFLPAGLFKPLLVISTLMLAIDAPLRSKGVPAGVLLLVQSAVLMKPYVNKFFPSYVPEQAVDRLQKAEYQISEDKYNSTESDEEQ